MVLEAVSCKYCSQIKQVKLYRTTRAGVQRYLRFDCGRTFVQTYNHKGRNPLVKEQITQMNLNGAGIRNTARILGVNLRQSALSLKKVVKSSM